MNDTDSSSIHRYLDEAFADVVMTPDTQDLKEEIRGNLAARVAELQAGGMDAPAAATAAITELGDIHELIESLGDEAPAGLARTSESAAQTVHRNHVRPRPAFVVRAVLLSLLVAAAAVLLTLIGIRLLAWTEVVGIIVAVVFGLAVAAIVADSLRQETSQNFALPTARANAYGAASIAMGAGIGLAAVFAAHVSAAWMLVVAVVLVLASIVGYVWLGVTQTNRKKPWAVAMSKSIEFEDGFSQNPMAAARFGIYTVIIWVIAIAGFVVLSIAVGFAWSWLAIVAGLVIFFLVLVRMLFPADGARANGEKKP
jgi:MFS family permease